MAYTHPLLGTPQHWLGLALNSSSDDALLTALCFSISPDADGKLPEWVELIPAGDRIVGIDGRSWLNPSPQRVLDYFLSRQRLGKDLVFDWEHATELKAPKGEKAPASGWGKEMEIRDGAVWVRPNWTPRGAESITSEEYRYLSPALLIDKETNAIVGIKSVGLTNNANLALASLNQSLTTPQTEDNAMALIAILQALSLQPTATEADAVVAINQLKEDRRIALNSAQDLNDPSKFVPAETHQLALNRAEAAEQKLKDQADELLADEIATAINSAIEDGKIAPANKDYFTAMCQAEGGLDKFKKEYVAKAPQVVPDSGKNGKPPASDTGTELNASGYHKPDGYDLDPGRTALHNKAVAYQQEHKCDYATAAAAVGA